MESIRSHFLSRWLCLAAALTIFNVSVDTPDAHSDSIPEDLTYNDIETVVEWLLETVFLVENAIPEHDDADDNHPLKVEKSVEFFFYKPIIWPIPEIYLLVSHEKNFRVWTPSLQSVTDDLIQPPEA